MKSFDLELLSKRNTMIPCTITLPENEEKMPLLLMAHGFCATRHENGTYKMLAEKLSEAGIATIRCDFPGCNESKESHLFNTLENDMDNLDTMLDYMKTTYSIDETRIGMIGYSMGGKVVLHYTQRHPEIKTMALWAPAAMNGMGGTSSELGNEEWLNKGLETAIKEGVFQYPNSFDDRIVPLSEQFFRQCMNSKANDYFSAFEGNIIMVNGDLDDVIPYQTLDKVAATVNEKANFKHYIVKGANHGFGAWTNQPEQMVELVDVTGEFLIKGLKDYE